MPTPKRKPTSGDRDDKAAKKAKNEYNLKLFEKMKKEAEENKKKAAEKKQQESKKINRRITIAASSSSRPAKVVKKPVPKHKETEKQSTPSLSLTAASPSENEDENDESSSGEDEFDRLVQKSDSGKNSGRVNLVDNVYAKVYTRRPSATSKRQNDFLQRQQELFNKAQRGYHTSDDSASEEEKEEEKEEEIVEKKPDETPLKPQEPAASATAPALALVGGKDEVMMQIDTILFSIVCFFLGVLLVVGVYITLTSLDLTDLFTSVMGTTFTNLSGHLQRISQRVVLLAIALSIIFGVMEIFMWFNRRANSRKQVIAQLAKEAKTLIKVKLLYPSDFIMEEVLDECSKLTLNGEKINRSVIRSLWDDVVAVLLEDARMQSSDHIFEGKRRRCLRFGGGPSVQLPPSPSSSSYASSGLVGGVPPPVTATATGQLHMF